MAKIVDFQDKWAVAIGKAFLAFGSIEHVTFNCLKELPRDKIQRTTQSFRLGQRISLLVELLEAYDEAPYKELSVKLQRAKALTETRNLIAHNPLVLDIFEHDNGSIFMQEVIAHVHTEKRITLSELEQFASESEALASDLYCCSSELFQVSR